MKNLVLVGLAEMLNLVENAAETVKPGVTPMGPYGALYGSMGYPVTKCRLSFWMDIELCDVEMRLSGKMSFLNGHV